MSATAAPAKTKTCCLRPCGDYIIVRREEEDEMSKGGIVLPGDAREKKMRGTILAVGPGRHVESGERVLPDVREGDRIVFTRYGGHEIEHDDETFLAIREADIIAVIE